MSENPKASLELTPEDASLATLFIALQNQALLQSIIEIQSQMCAALKLSSSAQEVKDRAELFRSETMETLMNVQLSRYVNIDELKSRFGLS